MNSIDTGAAKPTGADLGSVSRQRARARRSYPFIEANDGARLFYRDWGVGTPVVFCHPWGLSADIFEYQLTSLSQRSTAR